MVDRFYNNIFLRFYHQSPALFAIILIMLGYSFLNINDALIKLLVADYSVFDILFWASLASFATMMALCQAAGFRQSIRSDNLHWHFIRGLTAFGTVTCVVMALAELALANFYAIVFLCPLVCVILARLIFGDELGKAKLAATILGFFGILVIVRPDNMTLGLGVLAAFGAMLSHSCSLLIVRKIGKDEPKLLFGLTRALIAATCAFIATGFDPVIPAWDHMIIFAALGFFGAIGATLVSTSFQISPSTSTVAPFHYIQMLWGIVIGYFFWAEVPTLHTMIGSAIIMMSGLWIIIIERGKKSFAPKTLDAIISDHVDSQKSNANKATKKAEA